MESEAQEARPGGNPVVAHNELAIVLGASNFDTGHINPDFLRYNEIVDSSWQLERPVVIDSDFSLVAYDNGLSLVATEYSLRISQSGPSLLVDDIVSPEVAGRYLAMAPWPVEYEFVGIDLRCSIQTDSASDGTQTSLLRQSALQVPFRDVIADFQVRVSYSFPDRSIVIYVAEERDEQSDTITELLFNAHIHRDIDSDMSTADRDEFISSILAGWKGDFDDLDELACQIYVNYIKQEA